MKRLNLITLMIVGILSFGCASANNKETKEVSQSETKTNKDGS